MSDKQPITPEFIVLRNEDVPKLARKILYGDFPDVRLRVRVDRIADAIRAAAVEVPRSARALVDECRNCGQRKLCCDEKPSGYACCFHCDHSSNAPSPERL